MHYADRPGKSAVERFMQFYFLNAKAVGDLTGVFLAQLDEQLGKKGFRFALADDPPPAEAARRLRPRPRPDRRSRPTITFATDPVRLLEMFALAAREQLEIHPDRDARGDPRRRR